MRSRGALLVIALAICRFAAAGPAVGSNAIGRILSADKKDWDLKIEDARGRTRDAAPGGILREGDSARTVVSQNLVFLLEDGTEIFVGPGSRVTFANWSLRDDEGRRVRMIWLDVGMLKAKVRKVYSQTEPFVVAGRYGVAAVRGTEFVVETGAAGRFEHSRRLTPAEARTRRTEFEVHALEGEVYVSRSLKSLADPSRRVSLVAGQTTVVRGHMSKPQQAHPFDLEAYRRYVTKAVPEGASLAVNAGTTNSERAERSANSMLASSPSAISPAQPAYARAAAGGRSIASIDPKAAVPFRSRRGELLRGSEAAPRAEAASRHGGERLEDAFSGGDLVREAERRTQTSRLIYTRTPAWAGRGSP